MKKLIVVLAIAFAVIGGMSPAYADPSGCNGSGCLTPSTSDEKP